MDYKERSQLQERHPAVPHVQPNPQVQFPVVRGSISTHCGRCGKEAHLRTLKLYEKPIDLGYKFCEYCAVHFYHFLRGEEVIAINTSMPHGDYVAPYFGKAEEEETNGPIRRM